MRKAFVMLLVLAGAAAFLANSAIARINDDEMIGERLQSSQLQKELQSRASRLGSSATTSTDTVWIGFTAGNQNLTYNYWSVGARTGAEGGQQGGQGGYQVGMWGFDAPFIDGDSLQGWWPIREWYGTTAGQVRPDYRRPWWAVDVGNNVNYRITGSSGRTYGVTGMWHRDDAGPPVVAPVPGGGARVLNTPSVEFPKAGLTSMTPQWTVLEGSYSAWMGLRALHDIRFIDPETGQPYSGEARKLNSGGIGYFGDFTGPHGLAYANNASFPGYMSQMDQMLYRDIDVSGIGANDLNISFEYATVMSTGYNATASTRVGWFQYDPLQPTYDGTTTGANLAVGNFISSTDALTNAPIDSFMVYVGVPVGNSFLASDGFTYDVYDPQRRWFSEVVEIDGYSAGVSNPTNLREIFSDYGINAPASSGTIVVPNSVVQGIISAGTGKLRLVFRVKTNRTWDDEHSTWSANDPDGPGPLTGDPGSGGKGAVQVDKVTYSFGLTNSPAGWGEFENEGDIDNDVAVDPSDAWKSTGKPPQSYVHVDALNTLAYGNLCGVPGSSTYQCEMSGVVLVFGDHDNSEASGGSIEGTADRETFTGAYSPTILMATPAVGANIIGLDRQESEPNEDYYVRFDFFSGLFAGGSKGNWWRYSFQAYPTADRNGNDGWMTPNYPGYIIFNPDPICNPALVDHPVIGNDMLRTTTATGIPDSVIIGISKYQACFRTALPTCAFTQGGYFDNVSLAVVDGTPADLIVPIWDWYNDSFPANETAGLPGTANFDTCTAYTKIGRTISPSNTTSLSARYIVPGDSVVTTSSNSTDEVHVIFRVLPGPGNYVNIGHPELGNGLRAVRPGFGVGPEDGLAATPGDPADFFESYMNSNGVHGTPGGHAGGNWDPNVWNSARMDTAGGIVFPQQGSPTGVTGAQFATILQSTYHDNDPRGRFGELGIRRLVCFFPTPTADALTVVCETLGDGDGYTPAAAGSNVPQHVAPFGPLSPNAASGWPGSLAAPAGLWAFNGNQVLTTEGTKIFPDGAFTPGTHIEYFLARYPVGAGSGSPPNAMIPDTTAVFPQVAEGSTDAHRWQQFGILPDLWKQDGYVHPVTGETGAGLACMLVYDNNDRRGNERTWVGIADTIGATSVTRQGAHNGWRATPADGGNAVNNPTYFVSAHLGQPGTTWDLYQMKASESTDTGSGRIGARLGKRGDGSNPQIDYKESRLGPTPEMLNAYYKVIMHLTGDGNYRVLAPFVNMSSDDPAIISAFLTGDPGATEPTRGYWAIGDGYVEDAFFNSDIGAGVDVFVDAVLGVGLKSNNYQAAATNTANAADLILQPSVSGGAPYSQAAIRNLCIWTSDVLERSVTLSAYTSEAAYYFDNASINAPFPSAIYKAWDNASKYIAFTDGWDIEHLTGKGDVSSGGRHAYMWLVAKNIFGQICDINGTTIGPMDVPNVNDGRLFSFAKLRTNPVETGMAKIDFSLAKSDRVQVKIFDVSGRLVRTLADRMFEAGVSELTWDGTDDGGRRVARGVYFSRFTSERNGLDQKSKLVYLR